MASRDPLRQAFESTTLGLCLLDANDRVVRVNQQWLRYAGCAEPHVVGRDFCDVFPSTPVSVARLHEDARRGDELIVPAHRQLRDGREVWYAARLVPIGVEGGTGVLVAAEDVTQRHLIEVGLRRSNRALHLLKACNQAIVRATGEDALFSEICRVAVQVGGYRMCWLGIAEHDQNRTIRPVAHAGHEDGYLATVQISWADVPRGRGPVGTAARTGRPVVGRDLTQEPTFEPWREEALKRGYRSLTALPLIRDGQRLGVIAMYGGGEVEAPDAEEVDLLSQLAGDLVFGISSLRERTATASAEAALRESEERLRVVVESAQEGILMRRRDGVISVFNPAAARLTGLTAEEMQGLAPYPPGWYTVREDGSLLPTEERPNRVALRTGRSTTNVIVGHHHADGSVTWCSVNSEPVFRHGESTPYAVVATFADLTAQRKQAAVQRQLEEQLHQARKLESIGRLAGGIAHDFNNLLTVILAGTQDVRESVDSGAPVTTELIDEVQTASRRAAELTAQLLAFARKQVIAPVRLELNAVVHRSEKLLRRVLGEDIELVTATAADLWATRCDPGQLDQVILNLAINARDAMPNGGRLTLETANAQADGDLVARHPFIRRGPYVRLTVTDTGTGMTPEVKERAFEPFFTTKSQGKGTGLGLSTVYGIVKQSNGYILLDSAVGHGTTFTLYFPVTEEAPGVERRADAVTGGSETVLVVEDDPQVRAVTLRALRSAGYRVLAASSGNEALEVAAHETDPIHLVVTDVIMPGLNGRQLAAELQRHRPALKTLYVSGYPGDVITSDCDSGPDVELLPKPFTIATLLSTVRRLLDAR